MKLHNLLYPACVGIVFSLLSCEKDSGGTSSIVSPVATFPLETVSVSINSAEEIAVMEGFGASDCWLPAQVGKYWTSNRAYLSRLLFSREIKDGQPAGIGLSQWRVNLGAGTAEQGDASGIDANNRAECFLKVGSDEYDWKKCAGQRYFMEQAKQYGCESFVLFSNSPLVRWTQNGKGYSAGYGYANLKPVYFDDFAGYLADVAEHFNSNGYNVTHISPVNEPQHNWDGTSQEGTGWKNYQIANLVKELDKALTERNSTTKILIPEAAHWSALYEVVGASDRSDQIRAFFNPASDNYVGNLSHVDALAGGHSYWSFDNWDDMRADRRKVSDAAKAVGIRLWQTEWSMLDKEPSEIGITYDEMSEFDIAHYMSKIIHNDITVAGCTSWAYWTAMSVERYGQKNRFELIKVTPSGGNYSDDFTTGGTVTPTDNLWVLGNYSLFVRPGYKRVSMTIPESKDFFGSAYVSPDGSTIMAVFTNSDKKTGVSVGGSLHDGRKPKSVWRYTTSATKHLQGDQFNPADDVFLDPYSVTTVVYSF